MNEPDANAVVTATPRPAMPIVRKAAIVPAAIADGDEEQEREEGEERTARELRRRVDRELSLQAARGRPRHRGARDVQLPAARDCGRGSELLAGVQQPLGVERGLDRPVQRDRRRAPLALEPASLDEPEPVLAGDAAAEPHREVEQLLRRSLGAAALRLVARIDQERGVEVAVAGVAPAAGGKAVPLADRQRLLDRLGKAVERARRCPRSPCRRARPERRARPRRASATVPRSRRRSPAPRPRGRPRRGPPAPTRAAARPPPASRRPRRARGTRARAAPGRSRPTGARSPRRDTRARPPAGRCRRTRASASQPAAVPSWSETIGATASGAGIRFNQIEVTTPRVPSEPTSRLFRS